MTTEAEAEPHEQTRMRTINGQAKGVAKSYYSNTADLQKLLEALIKTGVEMRAHQQERINAFQSIIPATSIFNLTFS